MNQDFLSGDVFVSANNSFVSKAIRLITSWQTFKALVSHAGAFVNKELIVEALNRVKVNHFSRYQKQYVVVYRIPLTEEERYAFQIGMLQVAAQGYGYTKLVVFAMDAIATKVTRFFGRKKPVFFFSKHAKLFNIPVCSQLVVWGVHKFTSYRFRDEDGNEVDWRCVQPDYFEDLLKLPINRASMIFTWKGI